MDTCKITVDEVEGGGIGINRDKDIQIRLSGENIKFLATEYSISIFVSEDEGDKLAFHINSLLQERNRKKDLTDPV